MSWKQTTVAVLGDVLRCAGRACITIDVILFGVFSVWLVIKLLWHTLSWLDRTIFSASW